MLKFCGSDNQRIPFENSKAIIILVPYGKTVSYIKGTDKGPRAIIKASDNLELFDEELNRETSSVGIATLPGLKVRNITSRKMIEKVRKATAGVLKEKRLPIIIGGEHSVTIGAVKAAQEAYSDISVLYFDSHADLRDKYKGSRYNHACVARRLEEIAPIVGAGIRSMSLEEKLFINRKRIKIFSIREMIRDKNWSVKAKKALSKNIYISIDLDVLDPSVMPSVGTPEPGGMGWYDLLSCIKDIMEDRRVVAFDVVELCPKKGLEYADFTAAKLIYKLTGYIFDK